MNAPFHPPARRAWPPAGGGILLVLALLACDGPPSPQPGPGPGQPPPPPPPPPHLMAGMAIEGLLNALHLHPDVAPPPPPPAAPLVRLRVKVSHGGQWEPRISGVRGTARDLDRVPWKAAAAGELPDYWIIVSPADGAPGRRYWAGARDPRVVLTERVVNAATGEMRGETVLSPEGFLSRRVPFFPGGEVAIYPAAGTQAVRTQAVAALTYGPDPPDPPKAVIQ